MARKKKKADDDDAGDPFMMMFVTLSMILLAFFILLNSMAVIDMSKKRVALGSLFGSFGMLPGSRSTSQKEGKSPQSDSFLGGDGGLQLFKQARRFVEELRANSGMDKNDADLTIDEKTGDIKLVLSDRLLFPAGTAVISLRLFPLLDNIAAIARKSGGTVKVTGHTDNRRTRGQVSNWELSLQRGTIVARHLESIGPLNRQKIRAAGASHYQPVTDNQSAKDRAVNRRVEIKIKTRREQ
ncbi:MAG: flagellar motor protein MotB [Deltaproteobacteria bacterium]|nr:flagellar motor protein MotB [Deltaproteobacteria bacterium]